MPSMTPNQMVQFLEQPLVVSFTTIKPSGAPHTTPIWYEFVDGVFYCVASGQSVKARNVNRDRRITLCIATHDEPYQYVIAEGDCTIISQGVEERMHAISARYYGSERGKKFANQILAEGQMVIFVLSPSKIIASIVPSAP